MKSHKKVTLGAFILILSLIPNGLGIKCWSCRSIDDPKCIDPFDNSTIPITNCKLEKGFNVPANMCRKIKIKVNEEWQYYRDCSYLGHNDIKGDNNNMLSNYEYTLCNDRDGCNSSSMFAPMPLLLIALVTAPTVLFKIFV